MNRRPSANVPCAAFALLLSCGLAGCAPEPAAPPDSPGLPAGARPAAEKIDAAYLEEAIRQLSDDRMEGRGPASAGDEKARAWIAGRLEELGLAPGAADGGWEQTFDVVGIETRAPESWRFRAGDDTLSLKWWEEFIAASGVQRERAAVDNAEVVFVGYGIQAPEYDWDDFKGADLRGKVLLMLNNDPDWDPELFEGERRLYYGRWTYKYESAARQGAAGAIIVHTTPSAGYPWQVVQTSWTGPQYELPAAGEPRVEVAAWTTWEATERLLAAAGHDLAALAEQARSRDFSPVPLGLSTSIELTNTLDRARTANVLGLLGGTDPEIGDEVVIYTAHHDHLGVGEADAEGDRIYNGARDNASGVAQVLAIARAFTALPAAPRRSVLFLLVAAEEQGLLGSEHYARHPTFPPGRIAANINFDGANIWGRTRDLPLIGMAKSNLDEIAARVAADQGREVVPERFPDRGSFYRSDQFNFAKIGVPALYFGTGTEFVDRPEGWGQERIETWTETYYHQPGDELDSTWDFSGMVEDARLGFFAGLLLAEQQALPEWVPGDEFEAAREEALMALAP